MTLAQTQNIHVTDSGWYDATGFHNPVNTNYLVGDVRGSICSPHCTDDFRDFFVFDLSGVNQTIASAKFAVSVTSALDGGYRSADPSENFELHDVGTPIATLVAGAGGVAAWSDLGTGVVYGSRTMTAADQSTVVEITLNSSAVAAMNSSHGLFGIGGSITTLDSVANSESLFGFSGLDLVELRLTLVPEPSTLILLAIGAIVLSTRRELRRTEATCGQS
jgi:outer membrane scaffolding protein for murein synthesis (MipA/OmpV family)